MKMRYFITALLLCLGLQTVQAQDVYTSSGRSVRQLEAKKKQEDRKFSADKIIVGGGLGLSFGDVTSIYVAPLVGYRITDHFAAGVSFSYNYYKFKNYWTLTDINGYTNYYDYKSSIISGGVWARYIVWKDLFVMAQFEENFMKFKDYGFDPNGTGTIVGVDTKYQAPSLLLGAGYRAPIGSKASLSLSVAYDVIQNEYSPYYNRIVPLIGFMYGF
jgi:hypothetical protein